MMGVSLRDVYPEAELATFMPFVLSSHMDNSPLTVLELDADLRIVRVSSSVTQMLGLNPQRLAGQPLLQALGPGPHLEPLQTAFTRLQTGIQARNRVESTHHVSRACAACGGVQVNRWPG